MQGFFKTLIGAAFAVALTPHAAFANSVNMFEDACTPDMDSFDLHVQKVSALGWKADDSSALSQQVFKNRSSGTIMYDHILGFRQNTEGKDVSLFLSQGNGITVCTLIDGSADKPIDALTFNKRFDTLSHPELRLMLSVRAHFYADATTAPQPPYAMLGNKRPKTDIGLVGQMLAAGYFTQ